VGFRSFAIIGAGHMGRFIVDELLRLKAIGTISSVTIISRSDRHASHPEWVAKGVNLATIDYNDQASIVAAFEGVDVAISTVKNIPDGIQNQKVLADAAKVAGVKIFVPSEWGSPSVKIEGGIAYKAEILDYLREIGLPFTVLYTGPWPDLIMQPFFGFDLKNGKAVVPGLGDTPITFTGRPDIARYVGYVFTNLPAEKLEWKEFHLEGERTTFNEILKFYQEKTGKALEISHIPPSELEKRPGLVSALAHRWDMGDGVVGDNLDNDLYPGWNPKKAVDCIE